MSQNSRGTEPPVALGIMLVAADIRMLYPVWILYCLDAGLSVGQAVGISAIADLASGLVSVISAKWAENNSRLLSVLRYGLGAVALGYLSLALALVEHPGFLIILLARVGVGFGNGLYYGAHNAYTRHAYDHHGHETEQTQHVKGKTRSAPLAIQFLVFTGLATVLLFWPGNAASRVAVTGQAIVVTIAFLANLRLPKVQPVHIQTQEKTNQREKPRIYTLAAYGAVISVAINLSLLFQVRYVEGEISQRGTFNIIAYGYLLAAAGALVATRYEKLLGETGALMGLISLAGLYLALLWLVPGPWGLVCILPWSFLLGLSEPVLMIRLTTARWPATVSSMSDTLSLCFGFMVKVLLGWVYTSHSESTMNLVALLLIMPAGLILGWRARKIPRGW